jgi:hypothetical protein
MKRKFPLARSACALAGLASLSSAALAQDKPPAPAPSSSPPIAFRGTMVCEQAFGAAGILRAPLDVVERGGAVEFARPLFNLDGTRVLGSELGEGSIDADGKVNLTSTWPLGGVTLHGDYSGALGPDGGTLTGRQSWRGPDGETRSRACQLALVPLAGGAHDEQETPK